MLTLRPYQEQTVRKVEEGFFEFDKQLIVCPTGSGKTVMFSALAAQNPQRTLILAHRDELIDQAIQKIHSTSGIMAQKEKAEFDASLDARIVVASVQTMIRRLAKWPQDHFGLVVIDECFPAGTLVDGIPIEKIRYGDEVTTHIGTGAVTHVFKNNVNRLVRATFSNGKQLICTPDHPIWTLRGFLKVSALTASDMVLTITQYESMRDMRERNAEDNLQRADLQIGILKENDPKIVCKARRGDHSVSEDEWDARSKSAGLGFTKAQNDGMEANDQGWKRSTAANSATGIGGGPWVADGVSNPNTEEERRWLSNLLQGGHWKLGAKDCSRGGWIISQHSGAKEARCEERRIASFARLVGYTVLKSSSDGEFERVCPGGVVYNLEVSNGNTYTADGFLVHNCHHSISDSWQKCLAHFDQHAKVLGVTATPDRADKRNLGRYYQNIADEIGLFDLIKQGFLSRIVVKTMPLKIDLSKVRTIGGDYSDVDLAETIEPYFDQIIECIKAHAANRKTLVFLPLVATSKKFVEKLIAAGLESKHVDGESDDRNWILTRFDAWPAPRILSNCQLLTEGYDCPSIDCVVILRPTKSRSLYSQCVGRGTRIHPGKKNLLLLDFLWMHERHSLVRPAHLIAKSNEEADSITEVQEEKAGGVQEELDIEVACSLAQLRREESLRVQLKAQEKKASKVIDVMDFAVSVHDMTLAEWQPSSPVDELPVTDGQVTLLKNLQMDVDSIKNRGHAGATIDLLLRRRKMNLATPRQLKHLRRMRYQKPEYATLEQASAFLDAKWKK